MGFRRPTLKPEFTGDLEGFELEAKRMSMHQLLSMSELSKMADFDSDDLAKADAAWDRICATLAMLIISWNLVDDNGEPESVTFEAIRGLDFHFVLDICNALGQTVKPDMELGKGSTSGDTLVEASLTMVPLSQSQAS